MAIKDVTFILPCYRRPAHLFEWVFFLQKKEGDKAPSQNEIKLKIKTKRSKDAAMVSDAKVRIF